MANPQFVFHIHKLSKAYPGGKQVLKDINLSFYPGAEAVDQMAEALFS